jgi:hypothetical protein
MGKFSSFRKLKLKKKEHLHNDKRIDPPRRHSNPKCVCTEQHRYKTLKVKDNIIKNRNRFTIILRDLNTYLSITERLVRQKNQQR